MLLSHLIPQDYGFGTPLGAPLDLDLVVYPKEARGVSQIHNPSGRGVIIYQSSVWFEGGRVTAVIYSVDESM